MNLVELHIAKRLADRIYQMEYLLDRPDLVIETAGHKLVLQASMPADATEEQKVFIEPEIVAVTAIKVLIVELIGIYKQELEKLGVTL